MPPKVNDGAFFDALDTMELAKRETAAGFPWNGVREDRYACEEVIAQMYAEAGLRLKRPRFAWAQSPRSMVGAISMLRQIHIGTRQTMVTELVPYTNPIETEQKRVLLDAILDVNLTVTMGANLRDRFAQMYGGGSMPMAIKELADILAAQFTPPHKGSLARPAGWRDWITYPVGYSESLLPRNGHWLRSQSLVFAPFVGICWLSRPPLYVKTEQAHLHSTEGPAVAFADGFEVFCEYDFPNLLDGVSGEGLQIEAPKRPEGVSAIDMLREAAKETNQKKLPPPEEKP